MQFFDPFIEYYVGDDGKPQKLYWGDTAPTNKRVLRSAVCHPRISTMTDDEFKRFMLDEIILSSMIKDESQKRIVTLPDEFSLKALIYESKITSKVFCIKMIRRSSIPYRTISKATIIPKRYERLLREKLQEIQKLESQVRILYAARTAHGGDKHVPELIELKRELRLRKLGLSEL